MLYLTSLPPVLRNYGLILAIAALWLFFWGLAPFHYGYWRQIEPIVLACYLLGALSAVWLGVAMSRGRAGIITGWKHPLGLAVLGWFGWQLIASLLADNPWRSWLGPVSTGEGAAWYLAMFACLLLMLSLWQEAKARWVLVTAAATGVVLLALLHLIFPFAEGATSVWRPVKYADYLAFMAGYVWLAFAVMPRRLPPVFTLAAAVLCLVVVIVSENRLAVLFFACALPVSLAAEWFTFRQSRHFSHSCRLWRGLAMAACVLPFSWYALSATHGQVGGYMPSLKERAIYLQMGVQAIKHDPARLLAGDGWGRFADDAFANALEVEGVRRFVNDRPVEEYGKILNGSADHSHSEPLEVLLSLGVPGLMLYLAIPLLILFYLPTNLFWRAAPTLVALTVLSFFWFPLPQFLGVQALALAALLWACIPASAVQPASVPRFVSKVAYVMVAAFLLTAGVQWTGMRYSEQVMQAVYNEPAEVYSARALARSFPLAEDRLRLISTDYRWVFATSIAASKQFNRNYADWYRHLLQATYKMSYARHAGARNAAEFLYMQNALLMNYTLSAEAVAGLLAETKPYYPASLVQSATLTPYRPDMAMPYLWNLEHFWDAPVEEEVSLLQMLLNVNPHHSIALWRLGEILAKDPAHREVANAMMEDAKAMNVGDIYPLHQKFEKNLYAK